MKSAGRRSSADLERRVSLLTWLIVVQLVLVLVLIGLQIRPWLGDGQSSSPKRQVEAPGDDVGMTEPGSADGDMDPAAALADNVPSRTDANRSSTDAGQSMTPPEPPPDRPLRVEILNGCGVNGLAARFAGVLRDQGFDVRDTRNADSLTYAHCEVIDRGTFAGGGLLLADTLGIPMSRIKRRPNADLVDVDVSLVLGNDFDQLNLQP